MELLNKLLTPTRAAHETQPVPTPEGASRTASGERSAALHSSFSLGTDIHVRLADRLECGTAQIDGDLEGDMKVRHLVVGRKGSVRGEAKCMNAEIRGRFDGELIVRGKLTVYATAQISGKVRFGEIVLWKGAEVKGNVKRMVRPGDSARPAQKRHPSLFQPTSAVTQDTLNPQTMSEY
ncbi:MAG TPA: polymer-forming cytoskeletal protein, partial [Burkholderiaceae bacterium]|nr:polymer-forming cytoskeletal protein [Burkholderiaceae bacterium]